MKFKDLNKVINQINAEIGEQETKTQKKLFKFYERIKPYLTDYNNQIEELRLDNASVDDKGIILLDEKGGYKFTKEALKKLRADIASLEEKEFDFKPIEVINPAGLEKLSFLKGWVNGVTFEIEEEEEL